MTWLDLLEAAIRRAGPGRLHLVAAELGYSKAAISLARHGCYPGDPKHIEARVWAVYGAWECPHLGRQVSADECADFSDRPTPTSSPTALRHWAACRKCEFNPEGRRP